MSITISSTTDTPEQVKAAIEATGYRAVPDELTSQEGGEGDDSESPESAEPPDTESGEAADGSADASGASEEEHQEPEDKPEPKSKGKKGIEDRFSELTKARREAEARAADSERRLAELERKLAEATKVEPAKPVESKPPADKPAETKPATEEPEPLVEDFEGEDAYTEWAKAHGKWAAREATRELRAELKALKDERAAEKAAQETATARQPIIEAFEESKATARERHDDYDAAIQQAVSQKLYSTPAMQREIVESPEKLGGEVMYYLATHPEECNRIAELTATPDGSSPEVIDRAIRLAAREIGRIESLVQAEFAESGDADAEPPTPKPKAPVTPQPRPAVRRPPPPVRPVGGSAAVTKDPSKMSTAEFIRWRDQGGR